MVLIIDRDNLPDQGQSLIHSSSFHNVQIHLWVMLYVASSSQVVITW